MGDFYVYVGEEGIEPSHGGFKGPCLTAWLLPNTCHMGTYVTISPPKMLIASATSGFAVDADDASWRTDESVVSNTI